jgi:asparagine synthase (glutamine-hydrolysing)
MGDYLALSWPPGAPGQAAERMRAALQDDPAWRLAHETYGLAVYVRGRGAPSVRPMAASGGVVIGDLFDRQATSQGRVAEFPLDLMVDLQPLDAARILTRHAWGRYVAILRDRQRPPWIYRDPTGALDVLTWVRDDVTIVSSDVPARGPLAPEGLAIDWSGIGALLGRHNLWSQVCPLTGVTAVDAGAAGRTGRSTGSGGRATRRAPPGAMRTLRRWPTSWTPASRPWPGTAAPSSWKSPAAWIRRSSPPAWPGRARPSPAPSTTIGPSPPATSGPGRGPSPSAAALR